MTKRPNLKYLSGAVALGGSLVLATALGVPTSSAAQRTSTVTYNVSPIAKLAVRTQGPTGSSWPYTPSQCVAKFGLACYTPSELRKGYNVPASATGAGQTIVIVDAYGSPTIRQDLAVYDSEFGLPAPPAFNIIYPMGSPVYNPLQTHNETSWAEETSLDVEQAHGLAPAATIDLVVAPNNYGSTLNNAVQYAVSNHLGNTLSMSYGAPEAAFRGNNDQVSQAEATFKQGIGEHMSFFASSGDSGATEGESVPSALFPASSPYVTSVGGTNLFLADNGAYQSETTWNDAEPGECPFGCDYGPFGATGGAPSVLYSAPSYQQGVTGYTARTTSDVSFNASVYTATMIYLGFLGSANGFYFFGGTSEGAPSWSAITSLVNQAAGHPLGAMNPRLYALYGTSAYSKDFHDITQGNNAFNGPGFNAGPGYDIPTGLGTPNVANLIKSLAGH
jgi:subtilase family serine protease